MIYVQLTYVSLDAMRALMHCVVLPHARWKLLLLAHHCVPCSKWTCYLKSYLWIIVIQWAGCLSHSKLVVNHALSLSLLLLLLLSLMQMCMYVLEDGSTISHYSLGHNALQRHHLPFGILRHTFLCLPFILYSSLSSQCQKCLYNICTMHASKTYDNQYKVRCLSGGLQVDPRT